MVSLILSPPVTGASALADLQRLLADDAGQKMVSDWADQPLTRIITKALAEATQARSPRPGLSQHDFACAAGEVAGMQRIVACLRDPELILDSVGMSAKPELPVMPKATYLPPVLPPAAESTDAAPQTDKGTRRKKST
jgi:hypothetical protein